MPSKIRDNARRLRRGESLPDVVGRSLASIGELEGEGAPAVCRTETEIAAADEMELQDLAQGMRRVDLDEEWIGRITQLQRDSWARLLGDGDEQAARRQVFDLFAGTPPTAVTGIAIAHLNDQEEELTGSGEADDHLGYLREEIRKHPEEVQRKLLEAVALRPVRAFIHRFDPEEVECRLEEIDAGLRRGDHLPLAGVALGVKDLFALGPTTSASRILADYIAPDDYEATAVENLRRLGATVVGKTNLDEFALGSSNESTAYWPAPRNPDDAGRVPGGSSGGSAAAVSAGMVDVALGTDTAGSIRVPASYCGCVGLKPTYGLVSRYGVDAMSSSLDCVGPLTSTVEDAAIVLGCLIGDGPIGRDQTQRRPPGLRSANSVRPEDLYTRALDEESVSDALRGATIGVPIEYFLDFDLDERGEAAKLEERSAQSGGIDFGLLDERREDTHLTGTVIGAFFGWLQQQSLNADNLEPLWREFRKSSEFREHGEASLDKLRRCPSYWQRFPQLLEWLRSEYGVELRLVSLPHTSLSIPAYFVISRYELASNLHRYDGLKYGRADREKLNGSYHLEAAARRMISLGTQPKQRILMGIHALQSENRETLLLRAQRTRYLIRQDFTRVFEKGIDLLLTPTVNTVAPHFGGFSDTVAQQQMDQFTVPADHAGLPAITVPFYRTVDESTPLVFPDLARELFQSAHVMAPEFEEERMFQLATAVERWSRTYGKVSA